MIVCQAEPFILQRKASHSFLICLVLDRFIQPVPTSIHKAGICPPKFFSFSFSTVQSNDSHLTEWYKRKQTQQHQHSTQFLHISHQPPSISPNFPTQPVPYLARDRFARRSCGRTWVDGLTSSQFRSITWDTIVILNLIPKHLGTVLVRSEIAVLYHADALVSCLPTPFAAEV